MALFGKTKDNIHATIAAKTKKEWFKINNFILGFFLADDWSKWHTLFRQLITSS